jgi:hypothetical protein
MKPGPSTRAQLYKNLRSMGAGNTQPHNGPYEQANGSVTVCVGIRRPVHVF